MSTSFAEFLRKKTEGSDVRERHRERDQWIAAVKQLLDQIDDWLRDADPEQLLERIPYEVQRVEQRLGIYDAPALKVRLGTEEVDITPSGRFAHQPRSLADFMQWIQAGGQAHEWGALSGGRVDITNGDLRYLLLREGTEVNGPWFAFGEKSKLLRFDETVLECILEDLFS